METNAPKLPPEICAIIIEQVGAIAHPSSYLADLTTLWSLCLVSRTINAITTPLLYRCLTIKSDGVQKLSEHLESNQHVSTHTRSLYFPSGIIGGKAESQANDIISKASSLQRLCIAKSMCPIFVERVQGLQELVLLHSYFNIQPYHVDTFHSLKRLAMDHINFHAPGVISALLQLKNLTHIAVVFYAIPVRRASISQLLLTTGATGEDGVSNLANYINDATTCPRVTLGIDAHYQQALSLPERLRRLITISRWEQVAFLKYVSPENGGNRHELFRDRILDGTLWDMRFE